MIREQFLAQRRRDARPERSLGNVVEPFDRTGVEHRDPHRTRHVVLFSLRPCVSVRGTIVRSRLSCTTPGAFRRTPAEAPAAPSCHPREKICRQGSLARENQQQVQVYNRTSQQWDNAGPVVGTGTTIAIPEDTFGSGNPPLYQWIVGAVATPPWTSSYWYRACGFPLLAANGAPICGSYVRYRVKFTNPQGATSFAGVGRNYGFDQDYVCLYSAITGFGFNWAQAALACSADPLAGTSSPERRIYNDAYVPSS